MICMYVALILFVVDDWKIIIFFKPVSGYVVLSVKFHYDFITVPYKDFR